MIHTVSLKQSQCSLSVPTEMSKLFYVYSELCCQMKAETAASLGTWGLPGPTCFHFTFNFCSLRKVVQKKQACSSSKGARLWCLVRWHSVVAIPTKIKRDTFLNRKHFKSSQDVLIFFHLSEQQWIHQSDHYHIFICPGSTAGVLLSSSLTQSACLCYCLWIAFTVLCFA